MTKWVQWLGAAMALPVLGMAQSALPGHVQPAPSALPSLQSRLAEGEPGDRVDIMTYNVHGLPWPIASGRPARLAEIGQQLRIMHQSGQAPGVVFLQEAFTRQARDIGRLAGYRYVAFGPGTREAGMDNRPDGPDWTAFEAGARWTKGEALGKFLGSGLAILSDYPISRVRRMSYGNPVCAGFDCLAAKGAMMAQLDLPDGHRIEVATTHMNSRAASAVPASRSDLAWLEQGEELSDFVAHNRDPRLPLVLGGDFNVGRSLPRQEGMLAFMARIGSGARDALRSLAAHGRPMPADARQELDHAKDWELAMTGAHDRLVPLEVTVPFGSNDQKPLSDHFGYRIRFAFKTMGQEAKTERRAS